MSSNCDKRTVQSRTYGEVGYRLHGLVQKAVPKAMLFEKQKVC